jgi:hypothetical protein
MSGTEDSDGEVDAGMADRCAHAIITAQTSNSTLDIANCATEEMGDFRIVFSFHQEFFDSLFRDTGRILTAGHGLVKYKIEIIGRRTD